MLHVASQLRYRGASIGWRLEPYGAGRCLPRWNFGDESDLVGIGPSRQKQRARDDRRAIQFGQERQLGYFSGIIHGN